MAKHVVLGKGQIGSTVAAQLVERGHEVTVLSRSGGTDSAGIRHVAVDASDSAALTKAAAGADVFYNCANPGGYHKWEAQWPPMAAAVLDAAEANDAGLVTLGNLYGYGEVSAPMTEQTPLAATGVKGKIRNRMWQDALARHEAGRVRVTEARASDYFGPGALADAMLGDRIVPKVIQGKTVSVLGNPEVVHSWSYIPDVAAALVRLGEDDRSWGRAWHVPSAPAMSQRAMIESMSRILGQPPVKVNRLPWWLLIGVLGTFQPGMRGFAETRHQWDKPFVMDSSKFTEVFGDKPTETDKALAETLRWWQNRLAA